jgi:Trk K+ transport system NAD-binding subunit
VVDNTCAPDDPRLGGARLVQGDCRRSEVLEQAGVAGARGVLILTSDDLVNISTALMVRRLQPEIRVVMRMFNQNLLTRLGKAVHNVYALSTSTLTAPLLALTALTGQALGTFRLEGIPDGRRQVAEVSIAASSPLRGLTVAEVATRLRAQVVTYAAPQGPCRYLADVAPDTHVGPGDRLVVCGSPRHLAEALDQIGEQVAPHLLWAGVLRRFGRVAWRTLSEVDLAVKICTSVLVSVVILSTLVFHYGMEKQSWADSLFRTISLIATGADMHGTELDKMSVLHPGLLKVFVSVLRLFGAALIASFTAIVTNYLLRARLHGALEIRRIPDSGHVIVCGLGNVGFRVLEELLSCDERVVAIELASDGRFVSTARRLGAAVITGDATVREVLRQAHAATARAVVAVTSDDLVNLEVALLVRELNPKQRVVLRMSDPNLAETLREAANVRLALSVPTLAAPAFVAALFGDRVLSVFLVQGRLLAALDIQIQPGDTSLAGQVVRAVAIDYQFLPVAVLASDGQPRERFLDTRLAAGDRLVGITALSDLERLLGRQPVPHDHAVDVTAFPLPARSWLAHLLQSQQRLEATKAEKALETLPVCLAEHLTRGQAEDLLALLGREKVAGKVRKCTGQPTD